MTRVRCCRWLALATVAALLAPHHLADAQVSASRDCDNGGKVTLAKGDASDEAIVYGAACNATTLTVDSKGKLTASGLKIQALQSVPQVTELNLALNALSAVPKLTGTDALTKLCVHVAPSNVFRGVARPTHSVVHGLQDSHLQPVHIIQGHRRALQPQDIVRGGRRSEKCFIPHAAALVCCGCPTET